MGINISHVLRQWAVRDGSRVALVLPTFQPEGEGSLQAGPAFARAPQDTLRPASRMRTLSYGELDERACRAAVALRELGLSPGDRVAICLANGLGFLDACFGAFYAGLTVLPVPPMSAPRELAQRLTHARCAALVLDARTVELGRAALALTHAQRTNGLP